MLFRSFSWVRMWGGDVPTAYGVQGVAAVGAVGVAAWVWRRGADMAVRITALVAALVLATPYVLDYDLIVLAVPLVFLAKDGCEKGFRSYQKYVMAALWILPLLARAWGKFYIPLTPPVMMAALAWCVWVDRKRA